MLDELHASAVTSTVLNINPRWAAPERLDPSLYHIQPHEAFQKAGDIYSLGMTIYEMMTNEVPFCGKSNMAVYLLVTKGQRPSHPGPIAIDRGLTDPLWSFVQQTWDPHRDRRPHIQELIRLLESTFQDRSRDSQEHNTLQQLAVIQRPPSRGLTFATPSNVADGPTFTSSENSMQPIAT